MVRLRVLLTLCLLLLGGLSWLADGRTAPTVAPADAARWEGQRVRVEGWASQVQPEVAGGQRLLLGQSGAVLPARLPSTAVREGQWLRVEGVLARRGGVLTLMGERAGQGAAPAATKTTLAALSADPGAWGGRRVDLQGTVAARTLRDGEGHAVALGDGPWPRGGAASVVGLVRYDGSCLCFRLDAQAVLAGP